MGFVIRVWRGGMDERFQTEGPRRVFVGVRGEILLLGARLIWTTTMIFELWVLVGRVYDFKFLLEQVFARRLIHYLIL